MPTKTSNLPQWLLLLCLIAAGMDLGGSFYEAALIVPNWSAAPPATLKLIQPQNGGINLVHFWVPIHGVFTLLLLAAIWVLRKDKPRRNLLLSAFGVYMAMRIWTFAYFIPEITAFSTMPLDGGATAELKARAVRWGLLSHGRAVLVVISTYLIARVALAPTSKKV